MFIQRVLTVQPPPSVVISHKAVTWPMMGSFILYNPSGRKGARLWKAEQSAISSSVDFTQI